VHRKLVSEQNCYIQFNASFHLVKVRGAFGGSVVLGVGKAVSTFKITIIPEVSSVRITVAFCANRWYP
jgi:hypothetical protein